MPGKAEIILTLKEQSVKMLNKRIFRALDFFHREIRIDPINRIYQIGEKLQHV